MKLYSRNFYFEDFVDISFRLEYLFLLEKIAPELDINPDTNFATLRYLISDFEFIDIKYNSDKKAYYLSAIISDNLPILKRTLDQYGFQSEIEESLVAADRMSDYS